jgi:hypothetical protein
MTMLDLRRKKELLKFAAGCLGGIAIYLVVFSQITRFIVEHPGDPRNLWIAAIPIVALLLVMVLAMRSLRGMDELQQKIHTEAMAFAFLANVLIISTAGFLALAEVMTLSLDWIAPTMMICWVIGLLIAILRYR